MQFSLSQVAAAILAVVTTASAGVWYLRGEQIDILKEQVSSYKMVNDMDLVSLAKSASVATKVLMEQLNELEEKKALIKKMSEQKGELAKLKIENLSQSNTIKLLNTQLNSLFASHLEFTLKDNEHAKLFKGKHVVAVRSVQYDDVYMTLNNVTHLLKSGEYIVLQGKEANCKLFLESLVIRDRANFSVLCDKALN